MQPRIACNLWHWIEAHRRDVEPPMGNVVIWNTPRSRPRSPIVHTHEGCSWVPSQPLAQRLQRQRSDEDRACETPPRDP